MIGIIVGAISAIGAALKTIGAIGLAIQGLKSVVGLLVNVAKALGIYEELKPETAEKALQAEEEGIKPENFDTFDEYMNEIENFEIDPEKTHTEEELLQKKIEILSGLILEKNENMPIVPMIELAAANPTYLTEARMIEIGKICGGDAEKMSELIGVLNKQERDIEKYDRGEKTLIEVEKSLDPTLTDSLALQIIARNN